jgi:predicted transcriptional regulator
MSLRKISERLDIKESFLKKYLKLLQDSSFIIKENFGTKKIFFTITENGLRLQRTIGERYPTEEIKFKSVEIAL